MIRFNKLNQDDLSCFVENKTHPEIQKIERISEEILRKIRLAGYAGNTDEAFVRRHSEKLATAYAIMRTKAHDPLRITGKREGCRSII